jgi:hypothetical protein
MAQGEANMVRHRRRKRSAASKLEKLLLRILPFALFTVTVYATWYVYEFLSR